MKHSLEHFDFDFAPPPLTLPPVSPQRTSRCSSTAAGSTSGRSTRRCTPTPTGSLRRPAQSLSRWVTAHAAGRGQEPWLTAHADLGRVGGESASTSAERARAPTRTTQPRLLSLRLQRCEGGRHQIHSGEEGRGRRGKIEPRCPRRPRPRPSPPWRPRWREPGRPQ